MIASAMKLEMPIPTRLSSWIRLRALVACSGARFNGSREGDDFGAEVDRVCNDQKGNPGIDDPVRIVSAKIPGNASARCPPDPGADDLDGGHQGVREQQRPRDAVTEFRPRLGVGRNPARIVV